MDHDAFVALIKLETEGKLTTAQSRTVLAEILDAGGKGDPAAIAAAKGFEAMDAGALDTIVDQVIADSPDEVAKYRAGEQKVLGALIAKVRDAGGDPKTAAQVLRQKLA
jgi:Asp-tRNA(Asn)/Glu-tRNA(Gln) amidotransferase B subunit